MNVYKMEVQRMENSLYIKNDRMDIPEELLKLTHEQIRERIKEERQKELEKKKKQVEKLEKVKIKGMPRVWVKFLSLLAFLLFVYIGIFVGQIFL